MTKRRWKNRTWIIATFAAGLARLSFAADDGLVAHYALDGNLNDSSGNTRNGLAVGSVTFAPDRAGTPRGSASLAKGTYIDAGNLLPANIASYTTMLWIKSEQTLKQTVNGTKRVVFLTRRTGIDGVLPNQHGAGGWATLGINQAGALSLMIDDVEYLRSAAAPPTINVLDGRWHHVAGVKDGNVYSVYLNGVRLATVADSWQLTPSDNTRHVWIGRHVWHATAKDLVDDFDGQVDEVRIYHRALSDAEVQRRFALDGPAPFAAVIPPPTLATDGERTTFSVTPTGAAPLIFQWLKNGSPIPGATQATHVIAITTVADVGSYSMRITNGFGIYETPAAALTLRSNNPGRLANLSVRASVRGRNGALIVGFVLGGNGTAGAKPLLVRAAGPALTGFGVANALPNPFLSVYDGGRLMASNDNWDGSAAMSSAFASVGAFRFAPGSADAAIAFAPSGGSYTAEILDMADAAGLALAEVYDAGIFSYATPRLVNMSARAQVGTSGEVLIVGFVVVGETPVKVLVRAVGPTLAQFGVTDRLNDPRLSLLRDAAVIGSNDDWGSIEATALASTAAAVGAFALPAGSKDSVILATLGPGSYTAQVSGAGDATGTALVEIYEVP